MAGRPSKLTPERQQKLVQAIAAGNYYETACRYAGIDYSNFRHWLEKGEQQASGIYHDFREAITRAEIEAEMRAVVAWQRAFPDDWRAAKEFLEHRHRETWGKAPKQETELSGTVNWVALAHQAQAAADPHDAD